MKYLLAVSGGVDSVVMLDMAVNMKERLAPSARKEDITVAHVDHGIRSDSGDDRRFVEGLTHKYGLEFASTELHLGASASEELARTQRYDFLFREAKKRNATIVTAHHADDLAGTIAINLHRGTGWRGLAVLGREGVVRPLLHYRKRDLYHYAIENHLEYNEDSTNSDMGILRNRLRSGINALDDATVGKLGGLRDRQIECARTIDSEAVRINELFAGKRYPYTVIDSAIAIELLRHMIASKTGVRPTRDEAESLLLAIKVTKNNRMVQLSGGARVLFRHDGFVVQPSDK